MRNFLPAFIIGCLSTVAVSGQVPGDSLWRQADSLSRAGLPVSALAVVEQIYKNAVETSNDPELVKSILYRIGLKSGFREDYPLPAISEVKKELVNAREPVSQLLHSILGELYWNYYQRNMYRLQDRSAVIRTATEDPETWDSRRLIYEIIVQYRESLADETGLQEIPMERFRTIIERPLMDNGKSDTIPPVHTTLFDLLAYRALRFFSMPDLPVGQFGGSFRPDSEAFFSTAPDFVKYPMKPQGIHARQGDGPLIPGGTDTLSLPWYAIRIYQDAIRSHLEDDNPEALIDWDLQRLSYVLSESTLPAKDSIYINALRTLEQDFSYSKVSAGISFVLAQALVRAGEKYNPLVSEANRWDLKSALDICHRATESYPGSPGGINCQALISMITAPSLDVTTGYVIVPDQPALASVASKNIPRLFFRLIKTDPDRHNQEISGRTQGEIFNFLVSLTPEKIWQARLPSTGDYQIHRTEIALPAVSAGFYVLLASADSLFRDPLLPYTHQELWSTIISYVTQRNEKGGLDVYILDRISGSQLKNATVESWAKDYDMRNRRYLYSKTGEYRTDGSGFLSIPPPFKGGSSSSLILHIHFREETLITPPFYFYPPTDKPVRTMEETRFFTDRAIYRPGQIIYFKGIVLERTGDSTSLKINKKTNVTFHDVNGQKIAGQQYITDEWGSFHGSFTAPSGVLLGEMRIFNESGSVSVEIEEYKRPTFEVIFDPAKANYMLGEPVTLTGKAMGYAGNVIDGGSVRYRVVRNAHYPFRESRQWIPFPVSPETEIINGVTVTDPDGVFKISFKAIPDATVPAIHQPVFRFSITAEITDVNGETRSAQEVLTVGYTSLLINTGVPEKLDLTSCRDFSLETTNLNGEPTPALVSITLQKLSGPDRAFRERMWPRPDTVMIPEEIFQAQFPLDIYSDNDNPLTWKVSGTIFTGEVDTKRDSLISVSGSVAGGQKPGTWYPDSGRLLPGSYKLRLTATDPFGRKTEKIIYFTAFSPITQKIPLASYNWFVPLKTYGEPGEQASFLIGTSESEIKIIREIRKKDSLVSREWITLKNQQKRIDIPILEDYRGNFSVDFLFVKDNRIFLNHQVVSVPYENKELDITFESFRDKLKPGQREEWKIRIADDAGNRVSATFLATLYDRSLDFFRPNDWTFDISRQYFYGIPWDTDDDFRTVSGSWYGSWYSPGFLIREYDRLKWFGLESLLQMYHHGSAEKDMRQGLLQSDSFAMETEVEADGIARTEAGDSGLTPSPENQRITLAHAREDFRETAFFYPSLVTDSNGILSLAFTAPDALTSWRFLGLAYTKDLDRGVVRKTLVTRKDLMVFPNVPRFVRQGDTVVFAARIVNLSEHEITGRARLNLAEALTMQPFDSLILDTGYRQADNLRHFTIPAGKSTSVSWIVAVPVSGILNLMKYTVSANDGEFSDGETNVLPVLTNRMLVTESFPLPVKGKGTQGFRFEKLIGSAGLASMTNYRLTLEFASNPAWYAIQALPALDEVTYRNPEQIFGSFYANALGSHIAGSGPDIRTVFESWKKLTPDALISGLEKNQDVKTAVLQETPWVMEALSETENMRKLGLFFEADNLRQNLSELLVQIQKMQYPSGGWPWFEGMQENRVITLNILTGLGRLKHFGVIIPGEEDKINGIVFKAIGFLDSEMMRDYERLRKNFPERLDDNNLTPFIVRYLYALTFFNHTPGAGNPDHVAEIRKIRGYFIAQAGKYWLSQDLMSQGMIALALNRLGDRAIPLKILKSLSERALHSPELGMYWSAGNGYEWFRQPVESQSVLIEAFDEVGQDSRSVEEMKTWLLKQKQTSMWRTRQATVDACFALLMRGSDLLADDQNVMLALGDITINPATILDVKQEAGTGYFRISWSGEEVKPDMGRISVTKSSEGIAWGGLYWQYFENLDLITSHQTPLGVRKELFVEQVTESGPVFHPLTDRQLRVGDKLKVRITVTNDRAMEFVHLKDMMASGLEPMVNGAATSFYPGASALSGYRYRDGVGYYQSTTDVATNLFFDYLPKGTFIFEFPMVVSNSGDFSTGIATIQCMYAPEFSAHSEGNRLEVAGQ